MRKSYKNLICFLLVGILFVATIPTMGAYAASGNISVTINGKALTMDQPPISQNGRTLVPLRAIFEGLGAQVQWDSKTQSITGVKGNTLITLMIGSKSANVNNRRFPLDVPAQIINGRTLVPIRFVAESLGAVVDWDATNKVVRITANVTTTPVIPKTTGEEYITNFVLTAEVVNESMLAYAQALVLLGKGHDVLKEIEELNRIHQELYNDFSTMNNVDAFAQSQFFMNSALFYYGLVLDETEVLVIDFKTGKSDSVLQKTSDKIDLFLERMESDFVKATEYFIKERAAFEKR